MRHAGQVLSREQLVSDVWGYDHDPGSNVVDVYVDDLRRNLGDETIRPIRGMGTGGMSAWCREAGRWRSPERACLTDLQAQALRSCNTRSRKVPRLQGFSVRVVR